MSNSRQSKIESIKRLIDPDSGATDGERQAAQAALERILKSQFGDAEGQSRLDDFYVHFRADTSQFYEAMARAFSGADFVRKKHAGVDMSGEWAGATIDDALFNMCRDFLDREITKAFLGGTFEIPSQPPKREKPITRTETVQIIGARKWHRHSKKDDMKGH